MKRILTDKMSIGLRYVSRPSVGDADRLLAAEPFDWFMSKTCASNVSDKVLSPYELLCHTFNNYRPISSAKISTRCNTHIYCYLCFCLSLMLTRFVLQGRIQEFKMGAWANSERVARAYNGGLGAELPARITGVWERSPQQGQSPWSEGQGRSPPEAESF